MTEDIAVAVVKETFGLFKPTVVEGTVVDTDGKPISNVEISIGKQSDTTSTSGKFILRGFKPGQYVIKVQYKSITDPNAEKVHLERGEKAQVTITLSDKVVNSPVPKPSETKREKTPTEIFKLGQRYEHGKGVKQDIQKAFKCYSMAAQKGLAPALVQVGSMCLKGEGVKQNPQIAFKCYLKAAKQGVAQAQHQVGEMYYNGEGVEKDDTNAFKWYMKAAEQGFAEAQRAVGYSYSNGEGVEEDKTKAFEWYIKAAEQGVSRAANGVGLCYKEGWGVEKDILQAFEWFLKSAKKGDVRAQYNVALCYNYANGVRKDLHEAFKWYMKAAEQGFAEAQRAVGYSYSNGEGVEEDKTKAFEWYIKAAEQGVSGAANGVGLCYEEGWGVEKDMQQAFQWYLKSAKKGNATAQRNIGYCYSDGTGTEKNIKEALYWWEKAAEQDTDGKILLGTLYLEGTEDIPQDEEKGLEWLRQAAEQESTEAIVKLADHYIRKDEQSKAIKWLEKGVQLNDPTAKVMYAFIHVFDHEYKDDSSNTFWFAEYWVQTPNDDALNNARKAYAGDLVDDMLILSDDSFWGGCKKGFLITKDLRLITSKEPNRPIDLTAKKALSKSSYPFDDKVKKAIEKLLLL